MDAWIIILIIAVALVLLAIGGAVAQRRRLAANAGRFTANLDRVNNDLAAAHAADKGWEPERLHAAARRIYAEHADGPAGDPQLVAVVDRPGTEDDKAVFEVPSGATARRLTLGRRGDDWQFEALD